MRSMISEWEMKRPCFLSFSLNTLVGAAFSPLQGQYMKDAFHKSSAMVHRDDEATIFCNDDETVCLLSACAVVFFVLRRWPHRPFPSADSVLCLQMRRLGSLVSDLSQKNEEFLSKFLVRGDPLGVRTQDPNIKSVVLYQLS